MGLLDELKKLTKPYDDEDYLEEDLAEPVRAPGRAARWLENTYGRRVGCTGSALRGASA